jgi:4'-phosphopantetheinyl transferase
MPWPDRAVEGIEVYCLRFDLAAEPHAARQHLTPAERAKADWFARTADRVRFTEARAALRGLLGQRLGCKPAEVPLASTARGKPYLDLAGGNAPPFNLSHSGAHALIALGDGAVASDVGIDIEECKAGVDAEAIASLAFTKRERYEMHAAADRLHALYSRWVAKEAVLKAIGAGVAEHLGSIGIHDGAEGRIALECAVSEWKKFQAVALDAPPGYAAALAWRAKDPT